MRISFSFVQKFLFAAVLVLFTFACVPALFPVNAQGEEGERVQIFGSEASLGVARAIEFEDQDVLDGSVVASSQQGAILSSVPYDSQVIGIIARDSAIVISSQEIQNGIPIISNGTVYVLVSTINGSIEKGDLLTTSTNPGVAMKAADSGYVIGRALESYENSDTESVGKIAMDLNLHYFNAKPTFPGTLSDIFKIALLATPERISPLLKYIIAAIVVLGSFTFAYLTFGRTAAKGVEALGRNPAAKGIIQLGIIFNVSIVVVIVVVGLIVAFLILRL